MEENRYIEAPTEEYVEIPEEREEKSEGEECYDLPEEGSRSALFSVLSLIFSILSVVLCPLFYLSLIFSSFAVASSLISRRRLGYFDKMSLFGLIVAIFGFVFGICSMIMDITGMLDMLLGK